MSEEVSLGQPLGMGVDLNVVEGVDALDVTEAVIHHPRQLKSTSTPGVSRLTITTLDVLIVE